MKGLSEARCDATIHALQEAGGRISNTTVNEAIGFSRYGKPDTLKLDSSPEIAIATALEHFNPRSVLITEELGTKKQDSIFLYRDPASQPVLYICDPTDRSKFLVDFLKSYQTKDGNTEIGDILKREEVIKKWEKIASGPASITGATTAITCLVHGIISFSVIFNYITREFFLACSGGMYQYSIAGQEREDKPVTTKEIIDNGTPITFPSIKTLTNDRKARKRYVTFLGKSGYQENFDASMIFMDQENTSLHYSNPGGPSRILYLSSIQPQEEPIGFIVANGEKIGEWIHWLAFVRFAVARGERSLVVYEIAHDKPIIKDGVLMTTPPAYSIFQDNEGAEEGMLIDASVLKRFPNACRFRSTLLVTTAGNGWTNDIMQQHQYRRIVLPPIEYI